MLAALTQTVFQLSGIALTVYAAWQVHPIAGQGLLAFWLLLASWAIGRSGRTP